MRVLNIRGRIRGEFMQKCTNIKCNSNNPNLKVMRLEKPIKARVDPELSKGGEQLLPNVQAFWVALGACSPRNF